MKKEIAEEIIEYMKDEIINLYSDGYDYNDITIEMENRWLDRVLKLSKGENIG